MEETLGQCQELKNIKYKSMLLHGVPLKETKTSNDLSNLEKFLNSEKEHNSNEPWCKLNKTTKSQKLLDYINIYKIDNNLNDLECEKLISFFKDCLDRKRLQRVKDVIYDQKTGLIKKIPALQFDKQTNHFTLKNIDKRVSTLKSLPQKKVQGTIKNKIVNTGYDSEPDNEEPEPEPERDKELTM
jgi:hypothetical protein